MLKTETYSARIYVGLKEGYAGKTHSLDEVESLIGKFVSDLGWCVTVTKTRFLYKDGAENGVIIGIINYPRFPSPPIELRSRTICLAKKCLDEFNQFRVSVEFPEDTFMLEKGGK